MDSNFDSICVGVEPLPAALASRRAGAPDMNDMLALPLHKRMVSQYTARESGARELRLYYGAKEISFDEPELFGFGEALAKQSQFQARAAMGWGSGYEWPQVKELLAHLIEEGVLEYASLDVGAMSAALNRSCPSPLPPAEAAHARSWSECEAITLDLTGRPVEFGYLELIVPIFRVAHMALDADGRQVGEANVFPRALRLDVPTEWMTCTYPGTRYLVDRPMNATALKAMRSHWPQMMAALHRIRASFLHRFPRAENGWTVGHLERLATLVLAVPSYQLMRCDRPFGHGQLHPALSSLFRVTDGLRMVMHQMLFVPMGEPTLAPDAPVTSEEILEYAERNYSFHSETGVCAGPKIMVQEFLSVLIDGHNLEKYASIVLEPELESALRDVDAAFDYGLLGLRAYAAVFSLWPIMTRAYEDLGRIAETAVQDGVAHLTPLRNRLRGHVEHVRTATYLATEKWRADREHVYADMYAQCGRGLLGRDGEASLPEQLAATRSQTHADAEHMLRAVLRQRFSDANGRRGHLDALAASIMDFLVREQQVLAVATAVQAEINRLLGRAQPVRPFGAGEVDVHNLLQGAESRRLPYLLDELGDALGIDFVVDACRIELIDRAQQAFE
jgi:hypothetical protein